MDRQKLLGRTLKQFRQAAKLNQVQVQDMTEIDQTKLSRIENGKQGVDQHDLELLAKTYGVRVSELFAALEDAAEIREPKASYAPKKADGVTMIPLVGWVQAGLFTENSDPIPAEEISTWVSTQASVSKRAYALEVEGDSMVNPRAFPTFPPGSRIIVDPARDRKPGDFVVAQISGENKATFKKLTEDAGRWYLTPLNPQYPALLADKSVRILGVVDRIAEYQFTH